MPVPFSSPDTTTDRRSRTEPMSRPRRRLFVRAHSSVVHIGSCYVDTVSCALAAALCPVAAFSPVPGSHQQLLPCPTTVSATARAAAVPPTHRDDFHFHARRRWRFSWRFRRTLVPQ
eukprot:3435980-Pyramimonas_sp.AAC.1